MSSQDEKEGKGKKKKYSIDIFFVFQNLQDKCLCVAKTGSIDNADIKECDFR